MATVSKLFCTLATRCLFDLVLRQDLKNIAARNVVGSNVLNGQFGLITTIRSFFSLQCTPWNLVETDQDSVWLCSASWVAARF